MTDLLRSPYNLIRPYYETTSFHKSVIEEVQDKELQKAYAVCRSITREHAKTFYMATRFLPNEKQRGIFAIYSLCRFIDDLVDEMEDLIKNKNLTQEDVFSYLEEWKSNIIITYQNHSVSNPILNAFSDVLNRYEIPSELPLMLVDGVGMDLYKDRYESFDELYEYSYKVASTVGLMTTEIFGYNSNKPKQYAVDLGIAMQLTNIIRDINEDLDRGRIYLPKQDLNRFNVTEEDLFSRRLNDNTVELIRFQIERARSYYRRAAEGIPMLSFDSRLPVLMAHYNYGRILNKIEKNGYNIFNQRAYLNTTEKLSVFPLVIGRLAMTVLK